MTDVVIYGSSGQARSVAEVVVGQDKYDLTLAAFIDDRPCAQGAIVDGIPVISFPDWRDRLSHCRCIIGLGAPADKRRLAEKVAAASGAFLGPVWERSIGLMSALTMGEGSYIGYGTYVGPGCTFGEHVSILANVSIGHDVRIGDFCTVCPMTAVSGNVWIEEGVFIGAGAVIVNGSSARPLVIGYDAMIAAGAVVTRSVAAGEKMAGNPARPMRALAAERRAERRPGRAQPA